MKEYWQILPELPTYQGNLHSHTVNSDGKLTPEQSVALFKQHGYNFLCLSEHDRYTDYSAEFNTEDFIILPGLEASAYLFASEGGPRLKVHHIHGILGTDEMRAAAQKPPFTHMEKVPPMLYYGSWDGAAVAQALCDSLRAHGCVTMYNHPIWSRVRESEFIDTEGLTALEIFNYDTVNESGTGYDVTYWDVMLREGKHIFGTATDDNHNPGTFDDACGGWISVQAAALTHEEIIQSFCAGRYYSSAGPQILRWGVSGKKAVLECSNVRRINFITGNWVGDGNTIMTDSVLKQVTGGSYPLEGHETYIRAECTDWLGRTAWTNPIYLKNGEPVNEEC